MSTTAPAALPARFDTLWTRLKRLEGGFSHVATDAGGPTKYGVTASTWLHVVRDLPDLARDLGLPAAPAIVQDIDDLAPLVGMLTEAQAKGIAKRLFWETGEVEHLPPPWDWLVLDWRYNGGPAIRELQRLAKVDADGRIGPGTCEAVARLTVADLEAYVERRLGYLRGLKGSKGWANNGRGWSRRVATVKAQALAEWPSR